jgi:hypothetical protein
MTSAIEVDRRTIETLGNTLRDGQPFVMACDKDMPLGRLAVETVRRIQIPWMV